MYSAVFRVKDSADKLRTMSLSWEVAGGIGMCAMSFGRMSQNQLLKGREVVGWAQSVVAAAAHIVAGSQSMRISRQCEM